MLTFKEFLTEAFSDSYWKTYHHSNIKHHQKEALHHGEMYIRTKKQVENPHVPTKFKPDLKKIMDHHEKQFNHHTQMAGWHLNELKRKRLE